MHHFSAGGLYNGLVLLTDDETQSYWDHITGDCVYGKLVHTALPTWPVEMTNVGTAIDRDPNLRVFVSRPPAMARMMKWLEPIFGGGPPFWFRKTMGKVDDRLPENEIGLGVIEGTVATFYRMKDIAVGITDKLGPIEIEIAKGPDDIPFATRADGSRPMQLFARWYGFSLTYPHCEIYHMQ